MKELTSEDIFQGGSKSNVDMSWLNGGKKKITISKTKTAKVPKPKITKIKKTKSTLKAKGGKIQDTVPGWNYGPSPSQKKAQQQKRQAIINADKKKAKTAEIVGDTVNAAFMAPVLYKGVKALPGLAQRAKNFYRSVTNPNEYNFSPDDPYGNAPEVTPELYKPLASEDLVSARIVPPRVTSLVPRPGVQPSSPNVGDDAGDIGDDIGDIAEDVGEDLIALGKKRGRKPKAKKIMSKKAGAKPKAKKTKKIMSKKPKTTTKKVMSKKAGAKKTTKPKKVVKRTTKKVMSKKAGAKPKPKKMKSKKVVKRTVKMSKN